MAQINRLVLSKIFGVGAITSVLAVGVYVLIIDLPKVNKPSVSVVEEIKSEEAKTEPTPAVTSSKPAETTTTPVPSTTTPTAPKTTTTTTTPTTPATPTTPTTPTNPTPSYSYRNGSFSSSKSYSVPGNETNTLTATIVISNDVITSVSTSSVNGKKSQEYNDNFKAEVSGAVVGKKINSLSINVLGSASLTSAAFNSILSSIRTLAKK